MADIYVQGRYKRAEVGQDTGLVYSLDKKFCECCCVSGGLPFNINKPRIFPGNPSEVRAVLRGGS